MAKNAKLTIVEVSSDKSVFAIDLMALLVLGREYRPRWLNFPKCDPSTRHLCRSHCTGYHREANRICDSCSVHVG